MLLSPTWNHLITYSVDSQHSNLFKICWVIFWMKHANGHIAHPEEKWHNSKSTIFPEKQYFFLIQVFKIEESETENTYVGKKGILYT
jgi:hypothetical protein